MICLKKDKYAKYQTKTYNKRRYAIRNDAKHFGCCSNIKLNFIQTFHFKYSILLWRSLPGLFVNCVHKDNQIHYPFYLLYAPPYFLLHNHKYNYFVSYISRYHTFYMFYVLYTPLASLNRFPKLSLNCLNTQCIRVEIYFKISVLSSFITWA